MSEATPAPVSPEVKNTQSSSTPPVPAVQPSIGSLLRAAREAKGLPIAAVAQSLKLSTRQVEALEADDWSHLPGGVFVRGFIRNYARFLAIDADPLLAALDAVQPAPAPPEDLQPHCEGASMPRAGGDRRRDRMVMLSGVALVLGALAVYFLVPGGARDEGAATPAEQTAEPGPSAPASDIAAPAVASEATPADASSPAVTPALPVAQQPAPQPAAKAGPQETVTPLGNLQPRPLASPAAGAAPTPAAQPLATPPAAPVVTPAATGKPGAAGNAALGLTFVKHSWVEVRDADGKVVFSQLSTPGSEYSVSGSPPFTVRVGKASTVNVLYKGKQLELSGRNVGGQGLYVID